VRAAIETAGGVAIVDLAEDEVVELDAAVVVEPADVTVELPRVVAADASGSLVVAVVARRPPLVVSHDAGSTWHETGHGLPAGQAVAVSPEHPDLILFASESRLYLSRDGGRFWQPLAIELEDIRAVAWLPEDENLG
jgi:hypothetical protein